VPDPWEPLRRNHPGEDSFVRACHERFDGLRLLRYLRLRQTEQTGSDEERLLEGVHWYAPEAVSAVETVISGGGFTGAPIDHLERLRGLLAAREDQERQRHDRKLFGEAG